MLLVVVVVAVAWRVDWFFSRFSPFCLFFLCVCTSDIHQAIDPTDRL
jgi:hypothetical protein